MADFISSVSDWDKDDLKVTSIKRFISIMKAIAHEDLWDDAEALLAKHGHKAIVISYEQNRLLLQMVQEKEQSGKGQVVARELMGCASNGPLGPRPGPTTPGGGGGPGGGRPSPGNPPPDGGNPPPPTGATPPPSGDDDDDDDERF
jgi:hypothetical protein